MDYELIFKTMYNAYCNSIHQLEWYKNQTSKQREKSDRWLGSDKGKMYFLTELNKQLDERENKMKILESAGVNNILNGLEDKIKGFLGVIDEAVFKYGKQVVEQDI